MRITFKDIIWALLSGLLITLPFLNFSLFFVSWFAFVPLLLVCTGRKVREGALLGLMAGIISGYGTVFWLARVTVAGYGLLGIYLAIYMTVWTGWISWITSGKLGWLWWTAPVGWVALEYLRTYLFTGFPWNLLGITQVRILPLIQISTLTGVYGVSFLIILVNSVLANLCRALYFKSKEKNQGMKQYIPLIAAIAAIVGTLIYGFNELKKSEKEINSGKPLALTLVQGGILQELKWKPSLASDHFKTYLDLSRQSLKSDPDLIIWPESSLPFYLEQHPSVQHTIRRLATEGGAGVLIGGDHRTTTYPRRYYNSAYFFPSSGEKWKRYDKVHLVPYGEYTPLKNFLPFLSSVVPWEDDFSAGKELILFNFVRAHGDYNTVLKLGTLICFEDIFPGLVREMVEMGAEVLINLTNDAWYGRTIAPFQHAYAALFRAVENRIYLARSTNTGYSCVIDPCGRIVGEVVDEKGESLFISDWATIKIYPSTVGTFYTKWGDVFSWICITISLLASLIRGRTTLTFVISKH